MTFTSACTAAHQMIDSISQVPSAYLRAIGSCMVNIVNHCCVSKCLVLLTHVSAQLQFQELSGVGHLLSGFIGRPLRWTEYQELRNLM
jgi:hypothetical protein